MTGLIGWKIRLTTNDTAHLWLTVKELLVKRACGKGKTLFHWQCRDAERTDKRCPDCEKLGQSMGKTLEQQALEKWGVDNQVNQCIEECAELIVALRHYQRGRCDKAHVLGEMADVYVMLDQMAEVFGDIELFHAYNDKKAKLRTKLGAP